MKNDFQLLMLSAMYENGGNTCHRLLDGHPELCVYPFESQIGTRFCSDVFSSLFPAKYRYPEFSLSDSPAADYQSIIDEEFKIRVRTPQVSKFRDCALECSDGERLNRFQQIVAQAPRSRAGNVAAFFRATFDTWKNYATTPRPDIYVGYSPIIIVDAEKIIADFPDGIVLHIVRNPWSAYADTKKRPVPMSLPNYMRAWVTCQHHALVLHKRHPENIFVLRLEDVLDNPLQAFTPLCNRLGIDVHPTLQVPSFNAQPLPEVYPWGTIRRATPEANRVTALELSAPERKEISEWAQPFLGILRYQDFLE